MSNIELWESLLQQEPTPEEKVKAYYITSPEKERLKLRDIYPRLKKEFDAIDKDLKTKK